MHAVVSSILLCMICCYWSTKSYRSSNEYEQYLNYVTFHDSNIIHSNVHRNNVDLTIGDTTATIHDNHTFITNDIIMSRIHQCNCERLNYCGEETVTYFNQHIPLFWNTTVNTSTTPTLFKSRFFTNIVPSVWYKANIDCHYEVVDTLETYQIILHSDVLFLTINFQIIQSQCINYTKTLLGGSSFEIVMESELSFVACGVIDTFDNSYDVNCTIPISAINHAYDYNSNGSNDRQNSNSGINSAGTGSSASRTGSAGSSSNLSRTKQQQQQQQQQYICFNLTVTLDYEHYSAFTDSKLTPVKLRHLLLNNTSICRHIQLNYSSLQSYVDHHVHHQEVEDNHHLRGYYIKHLPDHHHHDHDLYHHYHGNVDHQSYHSYYYLSTDRLFLDKHTITRCFNDSHPLYMLGTIAIDFDICSSNS